jgi:ATP-binding cassette subfamily B protein
MKKDNKKKYDLTGFWRYFAKFADIKNPYVWLFSFLQLVKPAFIAVQPYVVVKIMENMNSGNYTSSLNLIILFGAMLALSNLAITVGIDMSAKYFTVRIVKFNENWINKLTSHSNNFFQNKFGGSLTSNYIAMQSGYENLWGTIFENLLGFAVQLSLIIYISMRYNKYLGAIMAIYIIIFILLALFLSTKRKPRRSAFRQAKSEYSGKVADIITNIFTVITEGNGLKEVKFNQKDVQHKYKLGYANWRQGIWLGGSQYFINGIFISLASALSLILVKNGNASSLIFVFIISYGLQTTSLIEKLGSLIRSFEIATDDIAPMYEVLNQEVDVQDPPRPERSRISAGAIKFNNVKFSYGDDTGSKKLFSGFNLDIKPGERIGLVGPSGGGKSTITKLILRFMDVDGGEILIDGQDISKITQDDLRSSITYVPQEPLLFHRSLKENIAYAKPKATEAEIESVAKKARAHEFIVPLKSGYNTLVGERGTKLSGGQRQRVAIARAMLKDAPILILDEATSALDSDSEVKIQQALWELMKGKTAIVIAHRLSTIKHMDRIVVIENGKIKEQGSHTELLKLKGTYANLWKHQSGGFV